MAKLKRKVGNRGLPRPAILIVCEGEKTEPNYFKGFRIKSVHVRVCGLGLDPKSLIEATIRIKKDELKDGYKYNQIWCVFDKDEWPKDKFNEAIACSLRNKIRIAYSNEAFELWFLLHYDYITSALSRHTYIEKLKCKPEFGGRYRKNDPMVYSKLINMQENAIKNATKLLSQYVALNPCNDNPSTTVHCLVNELRALRTE